MKVRDADCHPLEPVVIETSKSISDSCVNLVAVATRTVRKPGVLLDGVDNLAQG